MTVTTTDIEVVELAHLDFDISCRASRNVFGECRVPAAWAVWMKILCEHQPSDYLTLCASHKEAYLTAGVLGCYRRLHFARPSEIIIRIEKIR